MATGFVPSTAAPAPGGRHQPVGVPRDPSLAPGLQVRGRALCRGPRRFCAGATLGLGLAVLLGGAPAIARGHNPGEAQGLAPGATVRVTRTDGTSIEARVLEIRPGGYFEVFASDGKAFRIPIVDVHRLTVTGRREAIRPAWSSEQRPYDLYEIERTDGTTVVVAMVQWGMFRLVRDGRPLGDYRSGLRSFEVTAPAGAPSAPSPDEGGTARLLDVTVMREGTGELEPDALVLVTDGRRSFLDTTGASGVASFALPEGGPWTVRARCQSRGDTGADVVLTPEAGAAGEPARIVIQLPRRPPRGGGRW